MPRAWASWRAARRSPPEPDPSPRPRPPRPSQARGSCPVASSSPAPPWAPRLAAPKAPPWAPRLAAPKFRSGWRLGPGLRPVGPPWQRVLRTRPLWSGAAASRVRRSSSWPPLRPCSPLPCRPHPPPRQRPGRRPQPWLRPPSPPQRVPGPPCPSPCPSPPWRLRPAPAPAVRVP